VVWGVVKAQRLAMGTGTGQATSWAAGKEWAWGGMSAEESAVQRVEEEALKWVLRPALPWEVAREAATVLVWAEHWGVAKGLVSAQQTGLVGARELGGVLAAVSALLSGGGSGEAKAVPLEARSAGLSAARKAVARAVAMALLMAVQWAKGSAAALGVRWGRPWAVEWEEAWAEESATATALVWAMTLAKATAAVSGGETALR